MNCIDFRPLIHYAAQCVEGQPPHVSSCFCQLQVMQHHRKRHMRRERRCTLLLEIPLPLPGLRAVQGRGRS
jgi:hypothetical protein